MTIQPFIQSRIDLDNALHDLRLAQGRIRFFTLPDGSPACFGPGAHMGDAERILLIVRDQLTAIIDGRTEADEPVIECRACGGTVEAKHGMYACFECRYLDTPEEFEHRQEDWLADEAEASREWMEEHTPSVWDGEAA